MKTILYVVFLIVIFPNNSVGQNLPEYNRFYKSCKNEKGIVTFNIPPGLLRIFCDKDEKEFKDLLKKVDEISFLIAETVSPHIFKELETNLPNKIYHDIMIMKDGKSTIKFKARETKDGFNEIIMSVEEPESLLVMCISGTFDSRDANSLVRSIKVKDAINIQQ